METGVRAWAQSGLTSGLRPFRAPRRRYLGHQESVRAFAADDAALRRRRRPHRRVAIDTWFDRLRRRRGPPGRGSRHLSRGGVLRAATRLFDELRARQHSGGGPVRRASRRCPRRRRPVASGHPRPRAADPLAARRGISRRPVPGHRELQEPLVELEDRGPRRARATSPVSRAPRPRSDRAPRRRRAFNQLAETNERGRAVEQHITDEMLVLDSGARPTSSRTCPMSCAPRSRRSRAISSSSGRSSTATCRPGTRRCTTPPAATSTA